jgi:ABC-type uncharacterized transport system permease subunit
MAFAQPRHVRTTAFFCCPAQPTFRAGAPDLHHGTMLGFRVMHDFGGKMARILYLLIQPGVISTGLMGTLLQVGLAFANSFNVAGVADMIMNYGLSGQLASGGLIAALTGMYYSFTQRKTGQAVAASAGAVAGGISGTLGSAITQALGWTAVAEGTTPLLNFTAIMTALTGALTTGDPSLPPGSEPMFDPATLTQVFGTTAAGGGIGAFVARMLAGDKRRTSHA